MLDVELGFLAGRLVDAGFSASLLLRGKVPGADAADRFARQLTAYLPLELVLPLPAPAS